MKRRRILACRLLCPFCSVVARVTRVTGDSTFVRLCCDHERTICTLPSKPGCVSFESADTPNGFKLFPVRTDSYGTMELDRERWTA